MSDFLLILAADEHEKSLRLSIFLESVYRNFPNIFNAWDVHVLTPSPYSNYEISKSELYDGIHFTMLDCHPLDDIYLYKTILVDFVKASCSPSDRILYLDYDHVCFSRFAMPLLKPGLIYTSSELSDTEDFFKAIPRSLLPQTNGKIAGVNTSLLFSYASDFLLATTRWREIGVRLSENTGFRNSEEIAFTASASLANIDLSPVSSTLQATWSDLMDSPLFHYGGDSKPALLLKSFLKSGANRNDVIDSIGSLSDRRERQMIAQILVFWPN